MDARRSAPVVMLAALAFGLAGCSGGGGSLPLVASNAGGGGAASASTAFTASRAIQVVEETPPPMPAGDRDGWRRWRWRHRHHRLTMPATPMPESSPTPSGSPSPTVSATPTGSPPPTAPPTQRPTPQPTGTLGRPEPAFGPNPFSARLTGNEQLDTNSSQEIAAMYAVDGHFGMSEIEVPGPGDTIGHSGETFSVAYATDLDPAFTIHCTLYSYCPEEGHVVHIPGGFEPADGWSNNGEAHAVVINWTEAREDGFYHLNQIVPHVGGQLNVGYGGPCYFSSYQNGKSCSEAATAGDIAMGGMLLRADELVAATASGGDLGHVLYVTTCVTRGNQRWPATTGNGNGNPACPPMGSRIVLRKTDAQIAALNVPEWDRVILRTIAHYGLMADDNNNNTVWTFGAEDDNGRTSLGQPAAWPSAISLIAQSAQQYGLDLSISNGSYHIALPYDTLQQSDMGVIASGSPH